MPKIKKINSNYSFRSSKTLNKKTKETASSELTTNSLMEKVKSEFNSNQSYLNLVLGLLIILVVGVLVFNYFKKDQAALGPAQQTNNEENKANDVNPENLPGKYTVKEGDTLFTIAENYYKDGFQFTKLAEVNKLLNANLIEAGQVLDIPKLEETNIAAVLPSKSDIVPTTAIQVDEGTGGAINQTIWGEAIKGDTYTVLEGDWLSKIAGRAYGDVMAFDKIAKANNLTNPDTIEPGTVLKIPR